MSSPDVNRDRREVRRARVRASSDGSGGAARAAPASPRVAERPRSRGGPDPSRSPCGGRVLRGCSHRWERLRSPRGSSWRSAATRRHTRPPCPSRRWPALDRTAKAPETLSSAAGKAAIAPAKRAQLYEAQLTLRVDDLSDEDAVRAARDAAPRRLRTLGRLRKRREDGTARPRRACPDRARAAGDRPLLGARHDPRPARLRAGRADESSTAASRASPSCGAEIPTLVG